MRGGLRYCEKIKVMDAPAAGKTEPVGITKIGPDLVFGRLWKSMGLEDTFRTAKSILETRPIYHKCDETIRGHVFCSLLALCLKRELELRLEEKGLAAEWAEVIRGLDNLQQVELILQGSHFLLRGEIKGHASQAVRAAEVALPPALQELT